MIVAWAERFRGAQRFGKPTGVDLRKCDFVCFSVPEI
jgi:hypothetical protein